MEENVSMEWNVEWKILSMEWKWNGRKLPVWDMEKLSSIPFHTMPWQGLPCYQPISQSYVFVLTSHVMKNFFLLLVF